MLVVLDAVNAMDHQILNAKLDVKLATSHIKEHL